MRENALIGKPHWNGHHVLALDWNPIGQYVSKSVSFVVEVFSFQKRSFFCQAKARKKTKTKTK